MEQVAPQCMRRCRSQSHAADIGAAILRGSETEAVAYMRWLCSNCAHVTDQWGRTALHWAASKGRRRVVEWLVKHRDALLTVRDLESGYTALHRSLFYGQIHVAVSLIKLGANMTALDREDLTPIGHVVKSRLPFIEFSKHGPGEAYVWGTNANFNLGIGNLQSRSIPELVDYFRRSSINIKQVALHMFHSVFVSDVGRVYSCGHGEGGRLGQDSKKPSLLPQPLKLPAAEVCVQASVGTDHTVLLMESGFVWSCGSNDRYQLGHNPPPKELLAPRSLPMKVLPGKVLGVCTGRLHTVLWAKDGLSTCGINAGQLGHPKGEAHFIVPKLVQGRVLAQALKQENNEIMHVSSSDAAVVMAMKKGTILVLHEFQCRTIASRMLHVERVVVTGGRVECDVEQSSEELRVCVLTKSGQLFLWQQNTQQLNRCMLQLKRLLIVTDVALTNQHLLFTTQDGEAFEGFIQPRKKSTDAGITSPSAKFVPDNMEDWEYIRVKNIPNVHRAVGISCDPRGRNFAVIQAHPKTCLLEVPEMKSSTMREQMKTLLQEACEEDDIHDLVFEVCGRRFACHRCVVGSRSEILAQLIAESCSAAAATRARPTLDSDDEEEEEEAPTIKLDNLKPEVFEQILQFIYTNQCDLLVPGPCSIKFNKFKAPNKVSPKKKKPGDGQSSEQDHDNDAAFKVYQGSGRKGKSKWRSEETNNSSKGGGTPDPLRGVAASARQLGLQALSKALDTVQYRDGVIELRGHHDVYKPAPVSFDRTLMQPLCDVSVVSLEEEEISAHRSILAARLEYFHSMFAHGWAEASRNTKLHMALPTVVLEVLLQFLYLDEAPQVFVDPELARSMLVVADQMFIDRLKEACECALAATLSLRNAPELLQLSATYNAPQLKLCCMQFISINLPTFIETRSLDEVEWEVLEELSRYHCELTPAMQHRTLTPHSHGPSGAELESIATSFPVLLDQECDSEMKKEVLDSKKSSKIKKRPRIHRVSSGDGRVPLRSRKESVSSNASDCSEDLERGVQPLPLAKELPVEEEVILLSRIDTPPATPPVKPPAPPVVDPRTVEKQQQWNNMFPDLSATLAAVDLNAPKPKAVETKKVTKLSQKQRKRLVSESQVAIESTNVTLSPVSPSPSKPAWGRQPESPGGAVARGLHDIMREEQSSLQTWGARAGAESSRTVSQAVPVPAAKQRHPSVSSPQSPGQAWLFPSSPSSSKEECTGQPSLQAIQADELQQRENLRRVRTKPLILTQIEDQAIQDLLAFYNANNTCDERITVRRVETGVVATPTWVNSHR